MGRDTVLRPAAIPMRSQPALPRAGVEVRQRNRANMVWTILYTDKTAITYRNEDAAAEDLKVGRRVIALGRFAEDSIKMKALRIDIRTGR